MGLVNRLGDYYLLATLGKGASSTVYKAHDRRQGRTVVLKALRQARPQEVIISQRLRHPHIVPLERVETLDDGTTLLISPYYPGKTLDRLLLPLPYPQVLSYLKQAASALAYAHGQGVVHCDIKPANLLLTKGELKLLDFGLARTVDDDSAFEQLGTLEYLSPEAARGQRLTPASDLWSLGVVTYELLSGVSPFRGATLAATLRQIAEATPAPIRQLRPEVPAALEAVVAQLLAKSPAERYASAEALLEDLAQLEAGAPLKHTRPSAPLAARNAIATTDIHLPERPATLFGRDDELALINLYLHDASCRLLTLHGMGGIGKTHLALWAAHQQAAQGGFEAIYFVPLIEVAESSLLAAIAEALSADSAALPAVARAIGQCRILLVLDNFEHLSAHRQLLAELLARCPGLVLLVTSRERLALEEEWVLPLRGLSLPTQCPAPEAALGYGALALFADCASKQRGFSLEQELDGAYAICSQLAGHPLGIRLAAALMKTHSAHAIAELIAQDLGALQGGSGHHASLKAVFWQSYRLLPAELKRLLAQISIFEGGFTLEAASAIAGATPELLDALLDRALLEQSLTRYHQHPLVQRFSRELADDDAPLIARHRAYFVSELKRFGAMLKGRKQPEALSLLEQELPNCLRALAGTLWEAELAEPLRAFYTHKGRYSEGYERFAGASGSYAKACAAWFALLAGNLEAAKRLSRAAMQGAEPAARLLLLNTQAGIALRQGRLQRARILSRAALALAEQLDNPIMQAACVSNLAIIAEALGDDASALAYYRQGLALAEASGNVAQQVTSLNNLADFYLLRRQLGTAKDLLERALVLSEQHGLSRMRPLLQSNFGLCLMAEGDYQNAEAAFREAYRGAAERGDALEAVAAQSYLAQAQAAQGDAAGGLATLRAALDAAVTLDDPGGMLGTIVRFAELLARLAHPLARPLAALAREHPATEAGDRALASALAAGAETTLSLAEAIDELRSLAIAPSPNVT